jgi:hypothetical protein
MDRAPGHPGDGRRPAATRQTSTGNFKSRSAQLLLREWLGFLQVSLFFRDRPPRRDMFTGQALLSSRGCRDYCVRNGRLSMAGGWGGLLQGLSSSLRGAGLNLEGLWCC